MASAAEVVAQVSQPLDCEGTVTLDRETNSWHGEIVTSRELDTEYLLASGFLQMPNRTDSFNGYVTKRVRGIVLGTVESVKRTAIGYDVSGQLREGNSGTYELGMSAVTNDVKTWVQSLIVGQRRP